MGNKSTNIKKSSCTSHFNSFNVEKATKYDVKNPRPGLEHAPTYGGVRPVNGAPSLDYWIYNSITYLNDYKPTQIQFRWKRPHTIILNGNSCRVNECWQFTDYYM